MLTSSTDYETRKIERVVAELDEEITKLKRLLRAREVLRDALKRDLVGRRERPRLEHQ